MIVSFVILFSIEIAMVTFKLLQLCHLSILLTACYHKVKSTCKVEDACRELHIFAHFSDKALAGHVIKSFQVADGSICELKCYWEPGCVSYNLGPHQGYGHTCELSNSDHLRDPSDLVPRTGYIYRGFESGCSSSPCPNNATCHALTSATFKCLCPVGFTGANCEKDIDECQTNQYNCPLNETCINTVGSYTCMFIEGTNCQEIKEAFPDVPDGLYWIQPDSGLNKYLAYCDMTSFGGGWTMCYTTDNLVSLTTEVTYKEYLPYGTNGYRTDCRNIQFGEILFVDETTGQKAFFTYKLGSPLVAMGNFGVRLPALFVGGGIANTNYEYQLLICDTPFYSGFFVSGYTNCLKYCHSWCGDLVSPYFRSAATHAGYRGVAFNVNGHSPINNRVISVGLR